MVTKIRAVSPADRAPWQVLWDGYLVFYEAELVADVTDSVFSRITLGDGLFGAIAWGDAGEALGLVHWLYHPSTWSTSATCYLADLYVNPEVRGRGVGRDLIAHVRGAAEQEGAHNVYWHTHESNVVARALYDQLAQRTGHIEYEITRLRA